MKTLPADLADPLHILSPFPWRALAWLAAAALLALAWAWWRRRRRSRTAPAATVPPPIPATGGSAISQAIARIAQRYFDADRRRGCHELSATLRGHYDERGRRVSTLTVREIAAAVGDTAVTRLFGLLADLQFGRQEPSKGDFYSICQLAREVVTGEKR